MSTTQSPVAESAEGVLQRIPPFPAALALIMRACASANSSAGEIAKAISMEEVLAAKIVRTANSAALAPVQAVDNVTTAVARLGNATVQSIASAYFLSSSFSPAFTRAGLDRESLWRHNLAVATASAGAAGPGEERANAYFAGLMHDVGRMVLAAELGSAYADCLATAARTGEDLIRVEAEELGLDHARMGAEAAREWRFPPDIIEAIRRHHEVLSVGALPPLASHVLIGDQVAKDMGFVVTSQYSGPAPEANTGASASAPSGMGGGIMSRARWALTNEIPRIEAILSTM